MLKRLFKRLYNAITRSEREVTYNRLKAWRSDLFASRDHNNNITGYIVTPEQMEKLFDEIKP